MPQNGENAYLVIKKSKSFQGPKVGPGLQPIRAQFVRTTSLCEVGTKIQNFQFGPPLQKAGYGPGTLTKLLIFS